MINFVWRAELFIGEEEDSLVNIFTHLLAAHKNTKKFKAAYDNYSE